MKHSSLLLGSIAACFTLAQGACSSQGFGRPRDGRKLVLQLEGEDDPRIFGTALDPLPLTVDTPLPLRVTVRALDRNGGIDTSFNGYVTISSKPGAIESIDSPDAIGRSVRLTNGVSAPADVRLVNAYGPTFILATDLGYTPKDALLSPPPTCANGQDDDGDGRLDFPTDDGCAFANDDSESGGSYATGASRPIYFALPRVADARGLTCAPDGKTCSGIGKTPYPKQPIRIDTGLRDKRDPNDGTQEFIFDLVVTRIAIDGFYVSDVSDARGGFNSIFAFNFNAPPGMRVCDRLKTFAGTATEFFGLTQISYPTWTLEEWDGKRPCLVPEPRPLTTTDIAPEKLLPLSGSLVRVLTAKDQLSVFVTPKFGPGNTPQDLEERYLPAPEATNCDFNRDGKIDFDTASNEGKCAKACQLDPECTEYSNFESRGAFRLTLKDTFGGMQAIQADASASVDFKPLEMKGKPIKSFTGTLHYFSGGAQFTVEARCKDDIVVDLAADPLPSSKACVTPRTIIDENPQ
jgi:hypothetical protein